MNGELARAIDRFGERKAAAQVDAAKVMDHDEARLVLYGFDFDWEELMRLKRPVAEPMIRALRQGSPLPEVIYGAWVDGIVTGLLLAEDRAKAEAE